MPQLEGGLLSFMLHLRIRLLSLQLPGTTGLPLTAAEILLGQQGPESGCTQFQERVLAHTTSTA